MCVSSLEKVTRYSYANCYTVAQWSKSIEQCLQLSEEDLTQDLYGMWLNNLLLNHFFSVSRAYNISLGSYLLSTLTRDSPSTKNNVVFSKSASSPNGALFLSRLTAKDLHFTFNRKYNNHWAFMLHLFPSILSELDSDYNKNMSWAPILTKLLVILSHIVVVGLYPKQKRIQQHHEYDQDDGMEESDGDDIMKQHSPRDYLTASQQTMEDDLTASQQTPDDDLATSQQTPEDELTSSQQLNFSVTDSMNQWTNDSQMTIDPDATFDTDATQPDPFTEQHDLKGATIIDSYNDSLFQGTTNTAGLTSIQHPHQHPNQSSSIYPNSLGHTASSLAPMESSSMELENAIFAAKIMIDLVETKGIKGMIEKLSQERKDGNQVTALDPEDPWVACYEILVPDNQNNQNTTTKTTKAGPLSAKASLPTDAHNNIYIQKLLSMIERLMDRGLERRLALHMKYHELEDEGTARAMPSAGLMGLIYHMVQISPTLDDDELVNRLIKLQAVKGSFDESFYLEIWFTALTGLREASLNTSCQNRTSTDTKDIHTLRFWDLCCNATVSTNRLLWKNLILVKIPHLINLLQEQKAKEKLLIHSLKPGQRTKPTPDTNINVVQSSLVELKAFTGLLNACSPSPCCTNFYAPSFKSATFVNQFIISGIKNGEDDDNSDSTIYGSSQELNSPLFVKSIQGISTEDIFTSIVRSCEYYNLLCDNNVDSLLNVKSTTENTDHGSIRMEHYSDEDDDDNFDSNKPTLSTFPSYSSLFSDFDDIVMGTDSSDQQGDSSKKMNALVIIDQNIEQRMDLIRSNTTQEHISELLQIGLVSFVHWRKIVDFLLEILSEKALSRDIHGLSQLCGALCGCPSAINLILQLRPPSDLLIPLEQVCNEWNPTDNYMDMDDGDPGSDVDNMDDIQNWYFMFGKIWVFVLVVANKISVAQSTNLIFKNRNGLCYQFFFTKTGIYGVDIYDEVVDEVISRWLRAIGGDGISDDLLRTTRVQLLIQVTPTIIERLICIYNNGKIDMETLTGALSYFQSQFLQFLIVSGVTRMLCDELLTLGNPSTALACMSHLFLNQSLPDTMLGLCANTIVGSLRTWMEWQRQYEKFSSNEIIQRQTRTDDELAIAIEKIFTTKLDLDDEQHLPLSESSSTHVTRRTLSEKAKEMFRFTVKSGRSMYISGMDVDTKKLWEPAPSSKSPKQVVSHFLDLAMFQAALKTSGMHWFIGMIVDEILEAGKSGGAVRAAELGSSLLTMPLTYHGCGDDTCLSMLCCLLLDVIPTALRDCASKSTSFFQGQTLGVFVSDCLVLMYCKADDKVDRLGCQFFDALVIDRVCGGDVLPLQKVPQIRDDGSKFAPWDEKVVTSPVWRGFVKGLMSNPFIKEMWPTAYTS